MTPKISIVISAYKAAVTLAPCLAAMAQPFETWPQVTGCKRVYDATHQREEGAELALRLAAQGEHLILNQAAVATPVLLWLRALALAGGLLASAAAPQPTKEEHR